MLRPADDPFFDAPPFTGDDPVLDLDALDAFAAPRRLTRDEGRAAAGPDWSWTHLFPEEETDND